MSVCSPLVGDTPSGQQGGTHLRSRQGVPHPADGGYPSQLTGGYPIPGPGGVPHPTDRGYPIQVTRGDLILGLDGGGIPSQVQVGVPHPGPGRGYPIPGDGVPHPRSDGRYPIPGTPPLCRPGMGVPPCLSRPGLGYPTPSPLLDGVPPPLPIRRQSSIASICYGASCTPLAFTQEDFLVHILFEIFEGQIS